MTIPTLKKRADFLALKSSKSVGTPGFRLVYGASLSHEKAPGTLRSPRAPEIRVGYTVTKKLGNAVIRNRIKRRLRALVNRTFVSHVVSPGDFILIARAGAQTRKFSAMQTDLEKALRTLGAVPIP